MGPRTPSYRLHKPTGQAVVTLSGRDFYLGVHGTPESRERYDKAIAEWLANGRRIVKDDPITVAELINRYLDVVDASYTSNEPRNIRLALRPVRRLYGSTAARDFGPLALKAVRQTFLEADLCRGEVNKRCRRVTRMFKWAVGEELVSSTVLAALRAVEGLRRGRGDVRESEPVKPVPDALVDAVRPFVSAQVWTMIELQRLTGMRPGEVCGMRSGDLVTSGRIWEYRPAHHKTEHRGKARIIFIGPQAQEILRPWLRADLAGHIFQPAAADRSRHEARRATRKTRVQPSQRSRRQKLPKRSPGDRYTPGSYRRAIWYACDRAFPCPERPARLDGEKLHAFARRRKAWDAEHGEELATWRRDHRWHPHQLRHTAATRIRREFGLDTARAVLGHSTPVVTEVYAELDRDKAAEAMGRVG